MKELSLMFSGGVDSTTAALLLAESYDRIHLLSFTNGYGHYRLRRTARRAKELKRIAGEKFIHTILPVKNIFDSILINSIDEDYRKFGSGFIWCMGCKLSMHTQSIIYNLEHGITEMADGSSRATGEMVEQMLISIYMISEMYRGYGIRFRTPVYKIPRKEEIEMLEKKGFRMGFRVGSRFLGIQPKCRPGEAYYLPLLLFNQPPNHAEERVAGFIEEKQAKVLSIILENCKKKGIKLPVEG